MIDNSDKTNFEPELHPTISPITAAVTGLIGVFILYQFVGGLLTILIFGMDFQNADMNAVRLMTMGGQILFILFPALLLSKMVYEDVTTVIRFRYPSKEQIIVFSIGMIILIPLLQNYLYIQNYFIEQIARNNQFVNHLKQLIDKLDKLVEQTYGNMLKADSFIDALLIVVVVAITPAICEEIFFRGFVQKSFEQKLKPYWSALMTAIFFGLYHFNPYGLIPLVALGFYLGWSAYTTNSIFVPMILHFINNFTAVTAYFMFGEEDLIESNVVPKEGISESVIIFILLLILFAGLVFYIKKKYPPSKNNKRSDYDLSEM